MIDINMLRTMKYHWRVLALAMGVALVLIFQIARYVKFVHNNVWPQFGCNFWNNVGPLATTAQPSWLTRLFGWTRKPLSTMVTAGLLCFRTLSGSLNL